MIYVDDPIWPYGRMMMCHMIADTEDELHDMADKIGVSRKWVQRTKITHYDICKSKRKLAVELGAKEVDRKEFVTIMRRLRKQERNDDE